MSAPLKRRRRDAEAVSPFMVAMLGLCLAILFIPLVIIILLSFNASPYGTFPFEGTLKWYVALFTTSNLLGPTLLSLEISALVALNAALFGTMAAVWLDRRASRLGGGVFRIGLLSALTVPWLILGLAMLLVMNAIGLGRSLVSIYLGLLATTLPYVVFIVSARLQSLDRDLDHAARSLGASPLHELPADQRAAPSPLDRERDADRLHRVVQQFPHPVFPGAVRRADAAFEDLHADPRGLSARSQRARDDHRSRHLPFDRGSPPAGAADGRPAGRGRALSDPADGLRIAEVRKNFGATEVLKDITLHVPQGEFHTLLGPSGSGKTTLLKVVAGFTPADDGEVALAGRRITDEAPEQRNIGVVFQHYALFPHMTVAENVAFGLKMRRAPKPERRERVAEVLRLVRLTGFDHRHPAALSGGQQQRVALARALVIRPELLLLDEPLSALDRKVRQEVREELKRIQAETRVTTVMVTHDQEEALFLADRVLVLEAGSVRQQGAPADIYRNPVDEFVAGFLGAINLLKVTVEGELLRLGAQRLALPAGRIGAQPAAPSGAMLLAVRPEQMTAELGHCESAAACLNGRLIATEFGGPVVTLRVDVEGQEVSVLALSPDVLASDLWRPGAQVRLRIREAKLLPAAAGVA